MNPIPVDRSTLVFFDAAALIAASGRPDGGAGFLLHLVERGLLLGAVSVPVLREAERNISAKLPRSALARFHVLVRRLPWIVAVVPDPAEVRRFAERVTEKDAHVLAAALAVGAGFLVTFDRPLIEAIQRAGYPIKALLLVTSSTTNWPDIQTIPPAGGVNPIEGSSK